MNNFAVLEINYLHLTNAILIRNTTNNPCHLTCYYTDKKPGRHKTSRTDRGLTLPWGAYFCFVAWQSVEQNEPGDTLSHTFEIPDWTFCQTKWFVFRGTINGELSPSVSPVFEHHHIGIPVIFEYYNTGGDTTYGTNSATSWLGQTFTPSISHNIKSVKLLLNRRRTPGIITVSIRETDVNGKPTGSDLCLGTTNGDTLPTTLPYEWREITLGAGHTLLTGIKYAIVVRVLNPSGDWIGWRTDRSSPTYTGGDYCFSLNSGTTWTLDTGKDRLFEEWGLKT